MSSGRRVLSREGWFNIVCSSTELLDLDSMEPERSRPAGCGRSYSPAREGRGALESARGTPSHSRGTVRSEKSIRAGHRGSSDLSRFVRIPHDRSASSTARRNRPSSADTLTALLARISKLEAETEEYRTKISRLKHRSTCNEVLIHTLGAEVSKLYAENTAMRGGMEQVWERLRIHQKELLAHSGFIGNLAANERSSRDISRDVSLNTKPKKQDLFEGEGVSEERDPSEGQGQTDEHLGEDESC